MTCLISRKLSSTMGGLSVEVRETNYPYVVPSTETNMQVLESVLEITSSTVSLAVSEAIASRLLLEKKG